MDEPPKKKRRLLIIDVPSEGDAIAPPVRVQTAPALVTPGTIHGQTQQEILKLCNEARFDQEKIEDRIWIKTDEILKAKSIDEAMEYKKAALEAASFYFLINKKYPEKQAKAAERIAKMYRNKGEDEKADQQLAKAKKIRAEMEAESKGKRT